MMSKQMLEEYRAMTPRERIDEMRALIDVAERALLVLPPEEMDRRLAAADLLRRKSIDALLTALRGLDVQRGQPAIR